MSGNSSLRTTTADCTVAELIELMSTVRSSRRTTLPRSRPRGGKDPGCGVACTFSQPMTLRNGAKKVTCLHRPISTTMGTSSRLPTCRRCVCKDHRHPPCRACKVCHATCCQRPLHRQGGSRACCLSCKRAGTLSWRNSSAVCHDHTWSMLAEGFRRKAAVSQQSLKAACLELLDPLAQRGHRLSCRDSSAV